MKSGGRLNRCKRFGTVTLKMWYVIARTLIVRGETGAPLRSGTCQTHPELPARLPTNKRSGKVPDSFGHGKSVRRSFVFRLSPGLSLDRHKDASYTRVYLSHFARSPFHVSPLPRRVSRWCWQTKRNVVFGLYVRVPTRYTVAYNTASSSFSLYHSQKKGAYLPAGEALGLLHTV